MSDNVEFIDGFFAKAPHENAPEFVKAKVNIKREELLQWLSGRPDEWISVDIKEARSGKWYASVDNWKPDKTISGRVSNSPMNADIQEEDGLDTIPFGDEPPIDFDKDEVPF